MRNGCKESGKSLLGGFTIRNWFTEGFDMADLQEAKALRMAQFEQWLTACEEVAELWEGEFDSAADVRRMRDER